MTRRFVRQPPNPSALYISCYNMEDSSIAVILGGLPIVQPSQISKLNRRHLHRLNDASPEDNDKVLMPAAEQLSLGFV